MYFAIGIAVLILIASSGVSVVSENPSYDELFKKYAGADWQVLKKIAFLESTLGKHRSVVAGIANPSDLVSSVSEDGLSYGLLQFLPSTARDYDKTATPQKLNNPEYSIKIGALHLTNIKNYLKKNTPLTDSSARFTEYIVKSWNQGMGSVKKEITQNLYDLESEEYWRRFKNANV